MKALKKVVQGLAALAVLFVATGCPQPTTTTPEVTVDPVIFTPETGSVIAVGGKVTLAQEEQDNDIYYCLEEMTDSNVREMVFGDDAKAKQANQVEITEPCTIWAVAYNDDAKKFSKVTSASYTVAYVPTSVKFYSGEEEVTAAKTVVSGTKITLGGVTSQAEGDTPVIYYAIDTKLNSGNYETAGTAYAAEIEITKGMTIYAIAKGINGCSAVTSMEFKVPTVKLTAVPDEGDTFVIVNNGTKKIDNVDTDVWNVMLSTSSNGKFRYSNAIPVDTTLGGFALDDTMLVLTVRKNKAGQILLMNGGKYLTTSKQSTLSLEDNPTVYSLWKIYETAEDSSKFVFESINGRNNGVELALEYYSGFTSYAKQYTNNVLKDIYTFELFTDANSEADATELPASVHKLAAVTLDKEDGSDVENESYVFAASESLGVSFYYTTGTDEITAENYAEKTLATDGQILIDGTDNENLTINVIAVYGTGDTVILSDVTSVTYKVVPSTTKKLQKVDSIADGDVVVIFYPTDKLYLSANATVDTSKYSNSGVNGAAATMAKSGLVDTESLVKWTVKKEGDNFVFVNGGKFLAADATNAYLAVEDKYSEYALWSIEAGETEGTSFVKNVNSKNGDNNRYLEVYDGLFKIYTISGSKSVYEFNFYKDPDATAEAVVIPVLSPAFSKTGAVNANETVTLTCGTDDVTMFYQFIEADDTTTVAMTAETYSTAGTEYTAPVAIAKAGKLYAIAVKGTNVSEVSSAEYTINTSTVVDVNLAGFTSTNQTVTTDTTTVTVTKISGSSTSYYASPSIRFYAHNSLTFEDSTNKIAKIEFVLDSSYSNNSGNKSKVIITGAANSEEAITTNGIIEADTSIVYTAPEGGTNTVYIATTAQVRFTEIKITYAD